MDVKRQWKRLCIISIISIICTANFACSTVTERSALVPVALSTEVRLPGQQRTQLGQLLKQAKWTVLVFYSASCPCQQAHQQRLQALKARFAKQAIQWYLVDSEPNDEPQPSTFWPMIDDRAGNLADQLGATFATYTVILNQQGKVVYHGGIDSDRKYLTESRIQYVKNALDDLLAKRPLRQTYGKTLGCTLRRHLTSSY
jgi:hypothetical protein